MYRRYPYVAQFFPPVLQTRLPTSRTVRTAKVAARLWSLWHTWEDDVGVYGRLIDQFQQAIATINAQRPWQYERCARLAGAFVAQVGRIELRNGYVLIHGSINTTRDRVTVGRHDPMRCSNGTSSQGRRQISIYGISLDDGAGSARASFNDRRHYDGVANQQALRQQKGSESESVTVLVRREAACARIPDPQD